jgi:hypothetical protein
MEIKKLMKSEISKIIEDSFDLTELHLSLYEYYKLSGQAETSARRGEGGLNRRPVGNTNRRPEMYTIYLN